MRVAVTGAGGFIGANLVRGLLREGHEVCAILRPGGSRERLEGVEPLAVAEADSGDAAALTKALRRHRPEVLYHLASSTWNGPAPEGGHEGAIVQGMRSLLEACARWTPRRLVAAGSAAEYGSGVDFDEDAPRRPDTALGTAKAEAGRMAAEWAPRQGMECVWLRLFTPYGPWEAPARLVPSAIRAAMQQRTLVLRAPGEQRDFVAVADAVEAMLRSARAPLPNPAVLNVCTGEPVAVAELTELVFRCVGAEPRWETGPQGRATAGGETLARSSGRNRRAMEWLGWSPRLHLRAGIERAIAWWKERTV
ncbi:MAG: NAD(P)-dependent oxidoreductase [Bryobacterales bacterium]|nr:NAD(P)-dependent oxidoreductase [Bryobacterales bacterium]